MTQRLFAIMTFFEALFICAVNLYVLITGYFMRDSLKRDLLKPVQLLAQLFIIETVFFLIKEIPHIHEQENIFKKLISYYTPSYWFVFVYIALYIISPYINLVWKKLDKRNKRIFICIDNFRYPKYKKVTNNIHNKNTKQRN